jgi:hypothetical protein
MNVPVPMPVADSPASVLGNNQLGLGSLTHFVT